MMLVLLSTLELVTPDITLVNQLDQNITLSSNIGVIIGVQVPLPVVTTDGPVSYSQMVFQALAGVAQNCQISFDGIEPAQNLAVYRDSDMFLSFPVLLQNQQLINIKVTSQCDVIIRIVATAVHSLELNASSLTHQYPQTTVFVHKQTTNVNKFVQFNIDSDGVDLINICSAPVLMNIVWFDCKHVIKQNRQEVEINVQTSKYNFYKDYIYYSIQSNNESNKNIIAKIWDVYLINEEKQTAEIQPQQVSHYQVSVENTSEAFFNVTKIDGSEICFTQYFTHPEKVDCILLIKQAGKYNITPEMKHFFVQSNSETVSNVEFQIQREQLHDDKKSNTWVIWVVVSVVIGVLAVVATVVFYMRHKKYQTQIYSETDALNLE
ncbi:Hypothetical_protein [Hexamita inflata]|uniref:Hypothetical_protein n=1 Tax=Hexamita inflata TaxID=28002 RepID=A0AA86UMX0_9EUKA|nr:Hypothetical protein HINF_LOCUS52305 [Hexamita inflata]